ncbi:hypothetical protein D1007_43006 [Hordeum vulgare]|uniref:Uncharacterized protein n=1 Tax=Hordeum vulgare subsp. vulgare TaxID=112509 RepID=A0A8I6Y565_HORVV|nr:uncharacterized protein LOC123397657 [Hordeum vulgare subsp. vulgare]KAE8783489.1 hypothetical protein D1007_43006 [Hordeum vulgare]
MSSLAVRRGLEWELGWLGGLFTAAELAAADLLLQLSGDYEVADAASPATTSPSPSPRSAGSLCEDLAALVEEEKERIVEEAAPLSLRSVEKRARRSSAIWGAEDLAVVGEEGLEPPRIAREAAPSPGSAELDRRARKRYRLLSELYASTRPVKAVAPAAAKKKRKRHDGEPSSSSSSSEATRYGDY